MIHILANRSDHTTTELVARAFERSFTRGQVRVAEAAASIAERNAVVVALAADDAAVPDIQRAIENGGKAILLGEMGPHLSRFAGVELVEVDSSLSYFASCPAAPANASSESRAALTYSRSRLAAASPLAHRHFCRFDFTNEWNNLGYGRIGVGRDRWAIGQLARSCHKTIAAVTLQGAPSPGAAVTLRDLPAGAVLWFARPVGPIDGPDWAVVENFISAHRAGELTCRPFLRDIPHGCGAAVTTRLDCDEDIASARPLLELYRARGRPLSLAIKTDQPEGRDHLELIADLRAAGGSILSHTVTHAPNWGGSAEAAEREARDSKAWLENRVAGLSVRYAVSPFHQNPSYVPSALSRAGYDGFIGGIIANDPEYLMARSGVPPFGPATIVSHSQGCMLHGDCLLSSGDPLRIFKEAFQLARDGSQFFGYLDHPFSARYAYGWPSETARLAAHAEFLDYMDEQSGDAPLLFVNEDTCLDFIRDKAATEIHYDEAARTYRLTRSTAAGFPLSVGYQGQCIAARHD